MIDLVKREIVLAGRSHRIALFDVWFMVDGLGLYPALQDAIRAANNKTIQAMPVAVAEDGVYEVIPPLLETKIG